MTLLLAMLPFYLFGNLHCLGMCGPLVMMLGRHHYRLYYFAGRIFAFAVAAMLAGGLGTLLSLFLRTYHLPALLSMVCGFFLILLGIYEGCGWSYPGQRYWGKRVGRWSASLSLLLLKDHPWSTFLFGLATPLLPCGQTLLLLSACAMSASPWVGLLNGAAFAILTSPSLFLAMHAYRLFNGVAKYYRPAVALSALLVGSLAIARGMAELDWIPHLILNPDSSPHYHLVLY